jgi:hypothetical protein
MLEGGFWVFVLEGVLALVLAVLIVWWTLPRKKKDDRDRQ